VVRGVAGSCAARARLAANCSAPSLLLPRTVSAAIDQRTDESRVGAKFERTCLFDGGFALASIARFQRSRSTDRRPGLRLPTGLVAGREKYPLHVLPKRRDGIVAATGCQ